MTLIERVHKKARELDRKLIEALGHGSYPLGLADDRDLLEDVEKELTASRIHHPVPGQ